MNNSPEFWGLVLANLGLLAVNIALTVASFVAYRRSDGQTSYLFATVGFGCILLSDLVGPIFYLVVRNPLDMLGTGFMWFEIGEDVLIACGLALLLYGITNHESEPPGIEEETYKFGPQNSDE
ncbi:hypothetical protein OB920_20345 [Halobacteria archaeon HArc-gm2]|nr:hypothetical protein [Halobacteria archaeon HArc-gm2]